VETIVTAWAIIRN